MQAPTIYGLTAEERATMKSLSDAGLVVTIGKHSELKHSALAWLGRWRDHLPAAAVSQLQDILGVPK